MKTRKHKMSISIPQILYYALKEDSVNYGISMSNVIATALTEYYSKREKFVRQWVAKCQGARRLAADTPQGNP